MPKKNDENSKRNPREEEEIDRSKYPRDRQMSKIDFIQFKDGGLIVEAGKRK